MALGGGKRGKAGLNQYPAKPLHVISLLRVVQEAGKKTAMCSGSACKKPRWWAEEGGGSTILEAGKSGVRCCET